MCPVSSEPDGGALPPTVPVPSRDAAARAALGGTRLHRRVSTAGGTIDSHEIREEARNLPFVYAEGNPVKWS
jgi:hypothetical protein